MAEVSKTRRLVNPGRKKKRWSLAERAAFARRMKRARAAKSNPKRKRNSGSTSRARKQFFKKRTHASAVKLAYKTSRSQARRLARNPRRRKRNVSSILTIWPKGNPSRRRKKNRGKKVVIINKGERMARRRTRRAKSNPRRRRTYRVRARRRNYGTRKGRSWSTYKSSGRKRNPGRRRYHRRHRNVSHRRHYRRNPGMLSGVTGRIAGVIGGIAVTKVLSGFIPASFATGIIGNIATAVVAVAQGKLIGKISKNSSLGDDFMVGGLAYAVANFLNAMFPSIGAYTGISGMGLIGGSSFYVPQVNRMGNMGLFQTPAAVSMAMPAPVSVKAGVGNSRRVGRIM